MVGVAVGPGVVAARRLLLLAVGVSGGLFPVLRVRAVLVVMLRGPGAVISW